MGWGWPKTGVWAGAQAVQAGAHAGLLTWTGDTRGVSGPKRAKEPGPKRSGDGRGEGGVGVGLDAIFCLAGNYLNCSLFLESCVVHSGGLWAHVALDPPGTWTV